MLPCGSTVGNIFHVLLFESSFGLNYNFTSPFNKRIIVEQSNFNKDIYCLTFSTQMIQAFRGRIK